MFYFLFPRFFTNNFTSKYVTKLRIQLAEGIDQSASERAPVYSYYEQTWIQMKEDDLAEFSALSMM